MRLDSSGFDISAVLAFCAVIIAALLGLCGVLFSQIAPRQKTVNDALASLLTGLQQERAFLLAQNSQLQGQVNQGKQRETIYLGLLREHGISPKGLLPPDQ